MNEFTQKSPRAGYAGSVFAAYKLQVQAECRSLSLPGGRRVTGREKIREMLQNVSHSTANHMK